MKLLSLNIWGGIIYDPLIKFLEQQSRVVDVVCFQEVLFGSQPKFTALHRARVNIFTEITKCLPGFVPLIYTAPKEARYFQSELLPKNTSVGQVIFVRKTHKILRSGGFRTYEQAKPAGMVLGGKITGSCQWVEIYHQQTSTVLVMNLHGLWQRSTNKIDTPERLIQTQILQNFLRAKRGKKILCGDFNLKPDTESLKILEQGMINLIDKFGIVSTRSSLYPKMDKFADYVLVSPNVTVHNFEVLSNEVSDHLPITLEFG